MCRHKRRTRIRVGKQMTKEILSFYDREFDYLLCDLKMMMKIVLKLWSLQGKEDLCGGDRDNDFHKDFKEDVEWYACLYFLMDIKQLNEPIENKITEWNTGGLLTRIEGFRAFIPKQEMVKKVNSFTELKENLKGRFLFPLNCSKLFGFTVLCLLRLLCVSGEAIPSRRTSWKELLPKSYHMERKPNSGIVVGL
ncbi:hypothetical protein HID58_066101 [Brassica napus]|uniref:S1 motif domain-containing protein n=2 Tax=Brassica napus TaxID=3708 RepID=A0ABQ7ZF55_BRANA|nr:hypothetical protein HID58_066101 [Brassica napus]CDY46293.1 BnaC05g21630D [Brassica napus]